MISTKRNIFGTNPKLSFFKIFAVALICAILANVAYVLPSEGLTRYYNCVARVANKNATLTISNVDNCYNMIFKGALDYYGIKQQSATPSDNSTGLQQDHEKQSHTQVNVESQNTDSKKVFG